MLRFQLIMVILMSVVGLSACADSKGATPTPTTPRDASDQLFGILLTSEDLAADFPFLKLSGTRHLTNEAFAEMTPGATAADLEMQGLVDAYDIAFVDRGDPPPAEVSPDRPYGLVAIVHLLESSEAADSFMTRGGAPPGDHMQKSVRGAGVTGSQELAAPDVGELSAAVQVSVFNERLGREITERAVFWRRGPLVGRITIQSIDQEDRAAAQEWLALKMDERMATMLTEGG